MSRPAVLLLLLFCAFPLAAQTTPRQAAIGLGGGAVYGWQRGSFGVFPGSIDCGMFSGATAGSYWAGLQLLHPDLLSETWGLAASVRWQGSTAVYVSSPLETLVIFDAEVGRAVEIPREYRYSVEESITTIDLILRHDVSGGFAWTAGVWAGLRSEGTTAQIERSLDERYLFNGGRDRDTTMTKGFEPAARPFGFGLVAGATYELRLSDALFLQPEAGVRVDIASPIAGSQWQRLSIGGGLSILLDLFPPEPLPVEPPIIVETPATPVEAVPPAPPARLTASLDLRAVDIDENSLPHATVTIYETHVRRTVALPKGVEFPLHSAALSESYRKIGVSEASGRLLDSAASATPEAVDSEMLNILGLRMRRHPAARIALTGATARQEAGWLAYARVETIRSYLESVWGIDPARVDVRAPEEPKARRRNDPPGVSISGPAALVGPVELLRVDREFEPPRIRIVPAWDASAGLREWSIRFRHGASGIGVLDGGGNGGGGITSLDWQIVNTPAGEEPAPLSAQLTVVDSVGGMTSAADTIPLRLERRARVVAHRIGPGAERAIYTLYPESARQRNVELVANLLSKLPRGSRVSVAVGRGVTAAQGTWLLAEARERVRPGSGITLARRIDTLDPATSGISGLGDEFGTAALVVELPRARR